MIKFAVVFRKKETGLHTARIEKETFVILAEFELTIARTGQRSTSWANKARWMLVAWILRWIRGKFT